jgi:carbonic anhydrase
MDVTNCYILVHPLDLVEVSPLTISVHNGMAAMMMPNAVWERKLMPSRDRTNLKPDLLCRTALNPDDITDVTGMALQWSDVPPAVDPTARGLVIDVFGECKTTVADTVYTLKKVRLLLPGVHQQGDQSSPFEVHFEHEADRSNRLLLAVQFREGDPDPEVRSTIASILSKQEQVRLISLVPLSRRFYIHDASGPACGTPHREVHMIHTVDKAISSAQLAELHARIS